MPLDFCQPKEVAPKLINEWRKKNKNELLEDWELAENNKNLKRIKPLE